MQKASVIYLEFDCSDGPVIVESGGSLELTDRQMLLIKNIAFPESATTLPTGPHVFASRVDDVFCYCLYVSRPDPGAVRGYHQFSFVIATESAYYPIFRKLLQSAASYTTENIRDLYDLLTKFINDWHNSFDFKDAEKLELPMFTGTVELLKDGDLFHGITTNKYIVNNHFIGINLKRALGIKDLEESGRITDITRLWECCFIDEPILVVGSTPERATAASLAIASLTYPEPSPAVSPYVPITDERINEFSGIIGTSNPLAPSLTTTTRVFNVGFDKDNGFGAGHVKCPLHHEFNISNSQLRQEFFENTERLCSAVDHALDEMIHTHIVEFCLGQVNQQVLEKHIREFKVMLTFPVQYFAERLIYSKFFVQKRKDKLLAISRHLQFFDAQAIKNTLTDEQTMKICKIFAKSLKCETDSTICHDIKKHMKILLRK